MSFIPDIIGPRNPVSQHEHAAKYRLPGETFDGYCGRVAASLADNEKHRRSFISTLRDQRFLPGGRIQRAMGSPLAVTPYNCFVSPVIEDDSASIMDAARDAYFTMRMGGGIGYDFSRIRPKGAHIKSLQSTASGPVSFMQIFDATCKVVQSAGGRRGAQMGVLRVDHPDIEAFITAKQDGHNLTAFNISTGITDPFVTAVKAGAPFDLVHGGTVYKTVDARSLWDLIMRSTWDWAEPGVLFLDRINLMNNLWYCEKIEATNPCGEQPLPPNGACLLGSFNLARYVREGGKRKLLIDFNLFVDDIKVIVRGMDNVIDQARYPLPAQAEEARAKRRMGLGVTGMANAIEALGFAYGSREYIYEQGKILELLRNAAYRASIGLAAEKGAFPLFDRDKYLEGEFVKTLPDDIRNGIAKHGIRNSHLISIAPTGTISLTADNVSSGIEPVFAHTQRRIIVNPDGSSRVVTLRDYGLETFGVHGRTAAEVSPEAHVDVLCAAQAYVDSAVSKTCNVGPDVDFKRFREIYMRAYEGGAKGCTTFRSAGKRGGILEDAEGGACTIDPETGIKSCDE